MRGGRRDLTDAPVARGNVLVVDDSRVVRAVVARHLRIAGFQAAEAEDGTAALRLLATGDYDVVITDLAMPGLDGFGVLASVKKLAPSTEVIILTGSGAQDTSHAVRALRLGAHDYLTKPPRDGEEVVLTVERAVEKKRLKDENQRLLTELQRLSRTDALTGLPNRRSLDDALAREVARAQRYGQALSAIMLDVDRFKTINDTYGHRAGDEVLRALARVAASALRAGDTLYRFGGEEFVAILPQTDLAGALRTAQRIVAAVAARRYSVGSAEIGLSISAGVAGLEGDASDLLARSDGALYRAKQAGRNRACASGTRLTMIAGGRPA